VGEEDGRFDVAWLGYESGGMRGEREKESV